MEFNIFSYKFGPLPQGFVFGKGIIIYTVAQARRLPPLTSCVHIAKSCWFYLLLLLSMSTAFMLVHVTFISCINHCDNLSLGLSTIPLASFQSFLHQVIKRLFKNANLMMSHSQKLHPALWWKPRLLSPAKPGLLFCVGLSLPHCCVSSPLSTPPQSTVSKLLWCTMPFLESRLKHSWLSCTEHSFLSYAYSFFNP